MEPLSSALGTRCPRAGKPTQMERDEGACPLQDERPPASPALRDEQPHKRFLSCLWAWHFPADSCREAEKPVWAFHGENRARLSRPVLAQWGSVPPAPGPAPRGLRWHPRPPRTWPKERAWKWARGEQCQAGKPQQENVVGVKQK